MKPCRRCRSTEKRKDGRCLPCRKIVEKNTDWKRLGILHDGKPLRFDVFMEQMRRQGGRCAVCLIEIQLTSRCDRRYAVPDHDHVTKKFRGILCIACNTSLHSDFTVETLQRAISYLTKPPAVESLSK